ncbi:helix-turn-helix domain-containing protein [Streptomyces sp. SID11385]|uniref:winged helix-turn-helix domain-containing protein n=1 Tax=Streptomyces sp. SID11385 TaxID=2706031 RepID=UPI0013CD4B90|nr:helix-turn-helix domain-containing protein [Streptomyces sp. SID11385]NEA42054.1 helix-turn-helix transcriptional regulator [Streptomyces sp. SID11385]
MPAHQDPAHQDPAHQDPSHPGPRPEQVTELARLKAFTNPLRMRLYRLLYAAGAATASQLAEQVDEAPSLVSYHLRKLAEHGFVTEAPEHAKDGRERWWRVANEGGFGFRDSQFAGTPEGPATAQAVTRTLAETRFEQYRQYLAQASAWGTEWSDAATSSEWVIDLTADELAEMGRELEALAARWRERSKTAARSGDGQRREHVAVHLYGFPFRP